MIALGVNLVANLGAMEYLKTAPRCRLAEMAVQNLARVKGLRRSFRVTDLVLDRRTKLIA